MKKILFLLFPILVIVILLSSFSGNDLMYPGGAPAGYTGSPADGLNCTHCNNGSASTVQNWITSDVGPEGYLPGQTYAITCTVTGSGKKGFEVSPQNGAGDLLGTLIAGSGSKLVGSNKYITHTSSSNSNPKIWTFQWVAPVAGTGSVTFYGAFALSTSSTKLSTLVIPENIGTGVADKPVAASVKVYPDPADKDLAVDFSLASAAEVKISMVNSETGTRTLLKQDKMQPGEQSLHLNCSLMAEGLYILQINSTGQEFTRKIIIWH
jgi:hypothetical protein